jgi:hypothetical protein
LLAKSQLNWGCLNDENGLFLLFKEGGYALTFQSSIEILFLRASGSASRTQGRDNASESKVRVQGFCHLTQMLAKKTVFLRALFKKILLNT